MKGGGCYTIKSYHQHTGDCYITCYYTDSGCRRAAEKNDNMIRCEYVTNHSYCTNGKDQDRSRWHPDDGQSHKNYDEHGQHLVTVCGKSTSTFEGYKPSCGLQDGQIIGAHISYVEE